MPGTEVRLPSTFLYPVEVTEVFVKENDRVQKQQPLFKFKYWNRVNDGVLDDGEELPLITKEFYAIFESPFQGEFTSCKLQPGDRINDNLTPVCSIVESCDHSVQYGGLCALCGSSLDEKDYMGYSETDRAPIAMSHDTSGLTVSRTEAEKIELNSMNQLLNSKKLILVVDLDQTVIHCSVNQEVGAWINDDQSPQHDLVKDVKFFSLKERQHTSWYYVKLRPGLQQFLEKMNERYQMHVYTMATKNYALEVAKLIDPKGEFFADRILSRDATENLLHKSLARLFPVTTKMVTVIDDRGDVWNWSPHLVRVVPYQFWSGTGDINSQFLPHRNGLVVPEQDAESDATGGSNKNSDGSDGNDKTSNSKGDHELEKIGNILSKLHLKFYENPEVADTGKLLPSMKSCAFKDCVILFSGFFPLGTDLDNADIVQWVRSFGAVVVADFLPSVTHVVAKNAGTMKARQAAGYNKKIVSINWVFKCLDTWEKADETDYIMEVKDPLPIEQNETENAEVEEVDGQIAEGFMRSLQRGDVNWDEMDEELKELLGEEEDVDVDEDEENVEGDGDARDVDGDVENTEQNEQKDDIPGDNLDDQDHITDQHSGNNSDTPKERPQNIISSSENNEPRLESRKRKREDDDVELNLSDFSDDWD